MCGRLNQHPDHTHSWREYRGFLELEIPRINVAPTESLALIREGRVDLARWWLTPSWSDGPSQKYNMFNARSEKLTQSPAFRGPFKSQRGIVPMSSFIEWRTSDGKKQPWSIHREGETLYAAALWDEWRGESETLLSCTIVTTAAAKPFEPWHHRMPVLLEGEEVERWLDSSAAIRGPAGKSVGFSHFEHKRLILFNIMAPCLTGRWLYNDDGNPYQCDQSPRDVPTGERHSVNNTQPEESNAQIYARIGSISATCRRWVKRQQPRK